MRQIGTLPNQQQAEQFANHLRGQGWSCSVDEESAGYAIWLQNEDHLAQARAELQLFQQNPADPKFADAGKRAEEKLQADLQRQKAARRNSVSLRDRWNKPSGQIPVTFGLIAICAVSFFFTEIMKDQEFLLNMFIGTNLSLPEIRHGEIWRLVTPIFLHFGPLHILFNMLWLKDLGGGLEYRYGSLWFASMVLVIAVVSNLVEYSFGHLAFGGMSGVVFGLFGYVWIKGKIAPESGIGMPQQTVIMMLIWFAVCSTGLIGSIANGAHGGGLAMGALLAALPTMKRRLFG